MVQKIYNKMVDECPHPKQDRDNFELWMLRKAYLMVSKNEISTEQFFHLMNSALG